jgi:hypothetical protein
MIQPQKNSTLTSNTNAPYLTTSSNISTIGSMSSNPVSFSSSTMDYKSGYIDYDNMIKYEKCSWYYIIEMCLEMLPDVDICKNTLIALNILVGGGGSSYIIGLYSSKSVIDILKLEEMPLKAHIIKTPYSVFTETFEHYGLTTTPDILKEKIVIENLSK